MRFEDALRIVLRYEGGYVNHPADPGAATNQGITQRVYDAYRRGRGLAPRDVRQLEPTERDAIYHDQYWIAARCDQLPPGPLALVHFDGAVNLGPRRAAMLLQEALGVKVDGIIGIVTLSAAVAADQLRVSEDVLWLRVHYYVTRPHRDAFLAGWVNRVLDLRGHITRA